MRQRTGRGNQRTGLKRSHMRCLGSLAFSGLSCSAARFCQNQNIGNYGQDSSMQSRRGESGKFPIERLHPKDRTYHFLR